jgi:hypothetical protein
VISIVTVHRPIDIDRLIVLINTDWFLPEADVNMTGVIDLTGEQLSSICCSVSEIQIRVQTASRILAGFSVDSENVDTRIHPEKWPIVSSAAFCI